MRDPETSQELNTQIAGVVSPQFSLGQTFTNRRSGLDQVTLWGGVHTAGVDGSVQLVFELYAAGEATPRAVIEKQVHADGALTFSFPPQPDPPGQVYEARLHSRSGEMVFYGRSEDAYPYGQVISAGEPVSADLAFRTTYFYGLSAGLEDAIHIFRQTGLLLALLIVLAGPGWLLLDILDLNRLFDPGERFALALGMGLALLPLLMLWTSLTGLRWSWGAVIGGTVLVLAGIVWQVLRRPFQFRWSWSGMALAVIFLTTLWLRLAMVRDLTAPAWVDSVHHALITRLILENGGFPASYAPYFSLGPTQYHAGFHTGLAAFTWLTRLDLPEALLFYGQALNAAAAVSVYLFTTTFTRSRTAGLFAALLTGLVTPMPAYYASWGRYTQLAGLIILPAAPALLRSIWEDDRSGLRWRAALAAVLALGGLLLVHYRVAAFAALLLVAYGISLAPFQRVELRGWLTKLGLYGLIFSAGAVLISAPWTAPTLLRHIFPVLSPERVVETEAFSDFSWRYLTAGQGTLTLYLALLGLGLALAAWNLHRFAIALPLWSGLLFLLANPGALGLPGGGLVNNTSVQISMFMPISLLGGYATAVIFEGWPASLAERMPRLDRLRLPYQALVLVLFAVLLASGTRQLLTLLNPVTELFRFGDRAAMSWIQAHIPEEETILLNPFGWGYGVYAGADGGYWISPLTARRTLPPPVLYGMGPGQEARQIGDLAREVITYGSDALGIHQIMQENGLSYIYLGVRGGPISARALEESGLFRKVYDQEGVYIYLIE
jgi:hypothetical protein